MLQDSTNIITINDTDLDVTIITPVGTPRVLYQEVFLTVLGAITNGKNSMVKLISTTLSDNTARV